MIGEKLQTTSLCARFQDVRAGLASHCSHPSLGEAAGSEIAFTSVLPISPRIEAECFLLEKTKIKAVAEKSKAHFCFPSAALCSPGPRGEDVGGGLGSAGAFRTLTTQQRPSGKTCTGLVICSEADAGTVVFLGRWGWEDRSPVLPGRAVTAWEHPRTT